MSTTVTYKGNAITTVSNGVKTLKTAGKYLEADVVLTDISGQIASVVQDQDGYLVLDDDPGASITVVPLSVTANGTYNAPVGTVYNPVTVNVQAPQKQVNFIDYDGTLLYSYTKAEANTLQSLPSNPSHTGLVAQGWNWTLSQIKEQLTAAPDGDVYVGQMYITQSRNTEIDVYMPRGRLDPILTICVNGTITVDWGDNTTPDTVTGTSLNTRLAVPHSYASEGYYTISIHKVSGSYLFSSAASYTLLRKNTNDNYNRVYASCIRNIRLGEGTTSISGSFYLCSSLTTITIPEGVTSIDTDAFHECASLTSITIPNGVTRIWTSAFYDCYSLTSIAIPSTVTAIGSQAFRYCFSLSNITIPNRVTTISSYAFENCRSLSSNITIPEGVTSIAGYTFINCASLKSVIISDTVTSIGTYAFSDCVSLSTITIPEGVTSIGNLAFYNCNALTSIIIPSTVASIPNAFNSCPSLTSVTITDGVTSINGQAFQSCYSLASITIPETVTSIGDNAFRYCYGMAEYHILSTTPPTLGTTVFNSIPDDCKIYVPSASLSDYQTATNWSTYASYMVGE